MRVPLVLLVAVVAMFAVVTSASAATYTLTPSSVSLSASVGQQGDTAMQPVTITKAPGDPCRRLWIQAPSQSWLDAGELNSNNILYPTGCSTATNSDRFMVQGTGPFNTAGTFNANVNVKDNGTGSTVKQLPVTLTVGSPTPTPTPSPTPTPTPSPAPTPTPTPSPTPTPTPTPPPGTQWQPPKDLTWYWQLSGSVNTTQPVAAYDIDGFDNTAATVANLHAQGKKAICYISAGTYENWRPDASQFPASTLGNTNGWPGERWLDIRSTAIRPIMQARMQMCADRGFDAMEFDNVDGYTNSTGFPLTGTNQITYNTWLADTAHSLGLAAFLKNDIDQVATLQPKFDGAINEQCAQYSECGAYSAFLNANKPVLQAEYQGNQAFCSSANSAGRKAALFNLDLNGQVFDPCWA